jgi:hypothetical protein
MSQGGRPREIRGGELGVVELAVVELAIELNDAVPVLPDHK